MPTVNCRRLRRPLARRPTALPVRVCEGDLRIRQPVVDRGFAVFEINTSRRTDMCAKDQSVSDRPYTGEPARPHLKRQHCIASAATRGPATDLLLPLTVALSASPAARRGEDR